MFHQLQAPRPSSRIGSHGETMAVKLREPLLPRIPRLPPILTGLQGMTADLVGRAL